MKTQGVKYSLKTAQDKLPYLSIFRGAPQKVDAILFIPTLVYGKRDEKLLFAIGSLEIAAHDIFGFLHWFPFNFKNFSIASNRFENV